jgi:hypothetical protein
MELGSMGGEIDQVVDDYNFLYLSITIFFGILVDDYNFLNLSINQVNMEAIIGRDTEKRILSRLLASKEAELIAIYGRRRVGKTFLIRNFYQKNIVFEFTGIHEAMLADQLKNFSLALQTAMSTPVPPATPGSWLQAFKYLEDYLKSRMAKEPVVVFFDEFPWIQTPKSGFKQAFDHWWNTWASRQPQIKVVICGSAASWMIQHVVNDKGGLHGRLSQTITLMPFTLGETEKYLLSRGVRLNHYQLLQVYMAIGGVPQYLKQLNKGESATQAIDRLCFDKDGMLKTEFRNLYRSLFADSSHHTEIVRVLSKKAKGLSRTEIIEACKLTTGGTTTQLFEELEASGFITQYIPFGKTVRDGIYKLSDEYSLFYLKFVEHARASGAGTWQKIAAGQSYNSWSGFAFETVCQKHVPQIKAALGIEAVLTEASAWRYHPKKGDTGAQVDLLLDRRDQTINLCEIKFSYEAFVIDKRYDMELERKINVFRTQTETKKNVLLTMITTHGVKENDYSRARVDSEVRMEQLFK